MSPEFEFGRNIDPSEEVELTPVEKARQKIVKYLEPAKLKSIRFRAFGDYTRTQIAEAYANESEAILAFQTRNKQMNKVFGGRKYTREYKEVGNVVYNYKRELTKGVSDPKEKMYAFAEGLWEIRQQEIAKKSPKSSTPPQQ
jgi:hypothetical protein